MKTKSVWMVAGLAVFCAVSHGDEKAKEAAVKPAAASDYVPFVVPLPKDESGFATKPPEGGALKVFPEPKREVPSASLPPTLRVRPPVVKGFLKARFNKAPLSSVLSLLEQCHQIKIVACFSPEKLVENPKITMTLRGMSVAESLDGLKVIGLVWRNIGDTYYIGWSENDLPPAQNAITPAPQ